MRCAAGKRNHHRHEITESRTIATRPSAAVHCSVMAVRPGNRNQPERIIRTERIRVSARRTSDPVTRWEIRPHLAGWPGGGMPRCAGGRVRLSEFRVCQQRSLS
jgi:hypothetical protein